MNWKILQLLYCSITNILLSQSVAAMDSSYCQKDRIESISILYGVSKIASERQYQTQCDQELNRIYDGIHRREFWAVQALDSSAMPGSGFVIGHNFWMGSIKGCEFIQNPASFMQSQNVQFPFEYRMVYAKHESPWQVKVESFIEKQKILHIGLCVPKSCSNDEIADLMRDYYNSNLLNAQIMYDMQPKILKVKDLNPKSNWTDRTSFRLLSVFCFFTLCMMIVAYLREDIFTKTQMKTNFDEIIDCYSLRKNLQTLADTKNPSCAVPIVDGLKSFGCFLIVIVHVPLFSLHNATTTLAYGEQYLWHWVVTLPNIVDVFFTISGILLSYNFLGNQSKIEVIRSNSFLQNSQLCVKQLANRYFRLTPIYLVILGCLDALNAQLEETSPFWIHDRNDITCSKYWWRNLLYIQNLFNFNDLCMHTSWSLACEMQFFILFTVLLFIYAKYPNAAKAILFSLFGLFSIILFATAFIIKFTPAYDVIFATMGEMYFPSWTRILPYLIGLGAGYAMFTFNGVMPLNDRTIKLFWTMSVIIAIGCHFSPPNSNISHYVAAPLITLFRIFYPVSISWMIVASQTGHGGTFAKIMGWGIFVHLNKLSYAIYLLNPLVISIIYGWQDHSTQFNPVTMFVMTTGLNVIIYLSAIFFSVMFEIPYNNLLAKFLKQTSNRNMSFKKYNMEKSL